MANNIIKRVWNQGSMTPIEDLQGSAFTNENGGHTFQISGVDSNGESLALSGTVAASFLRPDQTTVGISGSVSGGVAAVTLSEECYGIPGRFGLVVFLTSDGKKTAIYSCVGNVARSSTDAVAPGVVADVVDLINEIETAVGTIPASYSALMADIAPTYSSSALYAVGDYAWCEGDLKRCIVPITVGETYTPAHWTSAVVGDDVCALKSAIDQLDEQINGEKTIVTTEKTSSDFEQIHYYIGSSSGKWIAGDTATGFSLLGDLTGCLKVSIKAKSAQNARIAFLRDDSCVAGETPNYAGGATVPIIVTAGETYEADVPSDATILYVYDLSDQGVYVIPDEILFYYDVHEGSGLADDVQTSRDAIADINVVLDGSAGSVVDVTSDVNWVSGGSVIASSGRINTESTNYSHADIPLDSATHVAGYTRAGQESTKGLCFLDSNGIWLFGDYHAGVASYDWDYSFDVPPNAAILRICCATSRLADFTCALTFAATDGLVDKVENIDDRVTALEGQSADVDIDELESELDYKWIDGYAVINVGSVSSTSKGLYLQYPTQSIAEADVSNCAGGFILGHTRLGDDYGIAFYDKNGMFISVTTHPQAQDYEWDFTIAVPANAKKVAVTCKTTSKALFKLSGKGIDHGVTNIQTAYALEYICPQDVFGLDSDRSDFHYDSQTRLQDMYTWFDILASVFPRNVTRVQIGASTTPEGTYAVIDDNTYPIYAYIIQGDSYIAGNDFIIASGIHGDESVGDGIQSVVSVAYFIRDLLCNPGKNEYLRFMKWNCKILVIPVMNPWGYQNGKRCNGRGVDVNRNFDINFDPTYESYGYSSGTEAFSENESDAVATYISEYFANAKYCTELHTRGGNTLPSDDRWFTTTTVGATEIQDAVTEAGYYMKWMYGGTVANGQQAVTTLPATFRAYVDHVLNIPANLVECAKSVNMDITTFNSDLVQRQYVQYLGAMTQKLVETFVM